MAEEISRTLPPGGRDRLLNKHHQRELAIAAATVAADSVRMAMFGLQAASQNADSVVEDISD